MPHTAHLTIGKLVSKLQEQFPDLSVSKVRYLENEGLLTPSRTPGGYRLYSLADMARLKTILSLQKTRFLPLAVIKHMLDNQDEAKITAAAPSKKNLDAVDDTAPQKSSYALQLDQLTCDVKICDADINKLHAIDRVPDLIGISVGFVQQLAEVGIIDLQTSPHGRSLVDGGDLRLICLCDKLRHFGFVPKALRPYVQAARRESGLIDQALVPYAHKRASQSSTPEDPHKQFLEALEHIILLSDCLRDTLIRRQINHKYADEA